MARSNTQDENPDRQTKKKPFSEDGFVVDSEVFERSSELCLLTRPTEQELFTLRAELQALPQGTRDVLTPSGNHLSLLDYAIHVGEPWAISILLEILDPNTRPDGVDPVLFRALRRSDEIALAVIMAPSVDVERRNAQGATALATAASYSRLETLRALLARGADPRSTVDIPKTSVSSAELGLTPLMIAARMARLEAIGILLPFSDVLEKDKQGRDALAHSQISNSTRAGAATAMILPFKNAMAEKMALTEAARSGQALPAASGKTASKSL